MTNVVEADLQNFVIPLPLDSGNAAELLRRKSIVPDLVQIDGGHDSNAVTADLDRWWRLLRVGGVMVVDDYDVEGHVWPSVRDAVDDFKRSNQIEAFRSSPYKCWMEKGGLELGTNR